MPNYYAQWFAHLIEDRAGNFASRVVADLMHPDSPRRFEVTFKVEDMQYRIRGEFTGREFVIATTLHNLYTGYVEGPAVTVPGDPWKWSKLEAFRVANLIDRAFRGHADRFDAKLP